MTKHIRENDRLRKLVESFPKLTFNIDLLPKLKHKDCYICELVAEIENIGNVRIEIARMSFAIHGLHEHDPIDETNSKTNYQVNFPHLVKKGTWFPKRWKSSFVETKTKQIYRFICSVPVECKAVVVHGVAEYSDSYHSANRLISLSGLSGLDAVKPAV